MKTKHCFGNRTPYTDEQINWAKSVIEILSSTGKKLTQKTYREEHLVDEFNKMFGRKISYDSMYHWFRTLTGYKRPEPKKDLMSLLMKDSSKFLLIINGMPIIYESEEQLQKSLEDPSTSKAIGSLGEVKLFKSIPIEVSVSTTVRIGSTNLTA